jgi:hypothetical protein
MRAIPAGVGLAIAFVGMASGWNNGHTKSRVRFQPAAGQMAIHCRARVNDSFDSVDSGKTHEQK